MTDKYKVPQGAMDELDSLKEQREWWSVYGLFDGLPKHLEKWINRHQEWSYPKMQKKEQAVIDYVFNDADNFEVKTPTWVIISEKNKGWNDWCFIFVTDGWMERWEAYSYLSRPMAIKHATRITDPHIKDMLLELNKDFEAVEVEE